jgi:hypothetical protein
MSQTPIGKVVIDMETNKFVLLFFAKITFRFSIRIEIFLVLLAENLNLMFLKHFVSFFP